MTGTVAIRLRRAEEVDSNNCIRYSTDPETGIRMCYLYAKKTVYRYVWSATVPATLTFTGRPSRPPGPP